MASHMDIFEFCIFYVVCFSALFSLTPLGSFPPRDIVFSTPGLSLLGYTIFGAVTWDIAWTSFIMVLGVSILIAVFVISLASNVNVTILGTGVSWNYNGKYVSTLVVGMIMAGGLGVSMSQMMPSGMPIMASFFLVWIWVVMLVYSVYLWAGAGANT